MKGALIIIRKELKRVFGDKRQIFSMFIFPAVLVIGICSLMGMLIGSMESDIKKHIAEVYFVNATDDLKDMCTQAEFDRHAKITYLTGTEFDSQKTELKSLMKDGSIDLIVVQDKDFDSKFRAFGVAGKQKALPDQIPDIDVYYNSAENYSQQTYSSFLQVLDAYREYLLGQRLGSLDVLTVFNRNDRIIAMEERTNSQFISMMLPYLIVIMLFAGARSIGVDAIAGEKERGTIANMLLAPVKRSEIVTGKLVSMAILSGLSSIVYSIAMIISMPLMGRSISNAGVSGFGGLSFSTLQAVQFLVIMLLLVFLYVSVISLIAVLAKDVRTANTYISPLYIVVLIVGIMTMFNSGRVHPVFHYMIPVYGNALAISDLCGSGLAMNNFFACVAGSIAAALILTAAITKAFNSEKVMFNA